MKLLTLVITSMMLVSCTIKDTGAQDHEAIVARQLVVEEFGPDIWKSDSIRDAFIARCADGSVWLVTFQRSDLKNAQTKLSAKTMIFDAMIKVPTEEP